MKKQYNVCTIDGDGIGPEVLQATRHLLEATGLQWNFIAAEAGYRAFTKYGTSLPDNTIKIAQKTDAILFGAVTSPPNISNYFSPIITLRKKLLMFANVRPFFSLPIATSRPDIDFVIVRENTEDLYAGKEKLTEDGAIAERIITKKACEQIITYAFNLAVQKKRKKVTIIHKANVLRITDGLFLEIGYAIAKKYPEIITEDKLVDAAAMQLIKKPESFDVIVTTNMFGDILSDEAAALIGGLGVAASANIGSEHGLFEPVHGSAPKHAGKNTANPLACFFAATMMLEYLGEYQTSQHIKEAIFATIKQGIATKDLAYNSTAKEFTNAVIENVRK